MSTDFKIRAKLRNKQQQQFMMESESMMRSNQSQDILQNVKETESLKFSKFKHKKQSTNIRNGAELPSIHNKFEKVMDVMIQDHSERDTQNIFGVMKRPVRPRLTQKINEDSESAGEFEKS